VILGLRLGPRSSPEHLFGWGIADEGEGWVRIEAATWFMTAHLILKLDEHQFSVALFAGYDRPMAASSGPRCPSSIALLGPSCCATR